MKRVIHGQVPHATGHAISALVPYVPLSVPYLPQRLSFGLFFTQQQSFLLPLSVTLHTQVDESSHVARSGTVWL
jgi:hypothetical protein